MTAAGIVEKEAARIAGALRSLPRLWDGKDAILHLREIDYQWRQMEWIGYYFEALCRARLGACGFAVPGEKFGRVEFDCKDRINWDFKASAIKPNNHKAVLNDKRAIEESIERNGAHGIALALVDVEYNDEDRSFQKWHSDLKGGLSAYEKNRIRRDAVSRYRKTRAELHQILLLAVTAENSGSLALFRQGRNADGSPRNPKYMLDVEKAGAFEVDRISF